MLSLCQGIEICYHTGSYNTQRATFGRPLCVWGESGSPSMSSVYSSGCQDVGDDLFSADGHYMYAIAEGLFL